MSFKHLYLSIYLILHLPAFLLICIFLVIMGHPHKHSFAFFGPYHSQTLYYSSFCMFVCFMVK